MPDLPELTPDCSACAALCCVGLAFDKGEDFAIDKPAGTPCPKLRRHLCSIHEDLDTEGFSGCVRFQCDGAGQRTVALFDGASWQDDQALLGPMLDTFRHLRRIHELIGLLDTAGKLPLDPHENQRRLGLLSALTSPEMTRAGAEALATGPLPGEIRSFLRSLTGAVTR